MTNEAQTYEEIINALVSNRDNKVITATIVSCQLNYLKAKSDRPYWQLVTTLDNSVPAAVKQADGTHIMNTISTLIMPYWNLELAMRHSEFYGAYTDAISNMIEAGLANTYLTGIKVKLLAEFVPAGEDKVNPFRRNSLSYGVKDYDRYIHHILSVETPANPIHLSRYTKLDDAITAMAIERMRSVALARKNGEAAREAILASAANVDVEDVF